MPAVDNELLFGLDISDRSSDQQRLDAFALQEREIYSWRYRQFDAAMRERSQHIGEWQLRNYLHSKRLHPAYDRVVEYKSLSMLHEDVLLLLRMYAQASRGAVVEIGPYIGGSTLAIADGIRSVGSKTPFVSIELGGRYPEHPHIPSDNIFGDLSKNVARFGFEGCVRLFQGSSRNPAVFDQVKLALGGRSIGLLFIDSDGHVGNDLDLYGPLLAQDAIVVFDDYDAPISALKADIVRPWVEQSMKSGYLRQLGVFGWGTWFGQVSNPSAAPSRVSWQSHPPRDSRTGPVNPHFDDNLLVWDDAYSGRYQRIAYDQQFDDQWRLFLERAVGFCDHTGVETSDPFIEDRIEELTGVDKFIQRSKAGERPRAPSGGSDASSRATGGTLLLEPKFSVDHFRGKTCLDVGCGAGRWTRVLLELGAKVKSIDVSEHGVASTRRFNDDVEQLDIFTLADRHDLHERFDFVICWGVMMCTHDPRLAFDLVARTVKPGGELYSMVYAPTYHVSDFVRTNRKRYHLETRTFDEKLAFAYSIADTPANAINLLDMLNTYYNWTIPEPVIHEWYARNGFVEVTTLNRNERHNCGWHVLGRKQAERALKSGEAR